MPPNLVLGLHTLLANPKPGVTSFAISPIIWNKTTGTTQRTSSPQPLQCQAEASKIHKDIFIFFLESREVVRVICMLPGRVAPHLTSRLTFLQCTSLNFTLQWIPVHHLTQRQSTYPPHLQHVKLFQRTELWNHSYTKKAKFSAFLH